MSFEGVTKTQRLKDSLWGKEKRCSKWVGKKFSTGPEPEVALYILLARSEGSGDRAQSHSLARAFAFYSQTIRS